MRFYSVFFPFLLLPYGRYYSAVRFKSSNGQNLHLKDTCDVTDQFQRRCSASNAHAWLESQHPTQHNTMTNGDRAVQVITACLRTAFVTKQVPFDLNYCKCDRREMLMVGDILFKLGSVV